MFQWWGCYGISATMVAVEHCLNGHRAKSTFVKEPLLAHIDEEKKELTIQEQREAFVRQLVAMQKNFELGKKAKSKKQAGREANDAELGRITDSN